jgi:ATP-dependent DNA helicase RecQ
MAAAAPPAPDLTSPLRRLFGFDRFRAGQEEIVRRALDGRDTLAVMPTGSGKSLCYQLAAVLRPEPTLVVSPLIALMKDQLDKLPDEVAAQATFVNSSLEAGEAARRLDEFRLGRVRMLYAAPERLRQRSFVDALASVGIGLVVVDEVHCVSMWGHDFRPDYLFIRRALGELGEPALLGMTATATPGTEREIGEGLGRSLESVRASVVRPNLHHSVEDVEDEEERRRALLERLRGAGGPAIVYARTRKKCESLARLLVSHGVPAAHYHAGMTAAERTETQEAFISGRRPVVVATTAFGMGIDKADIRLVLLYNYPGSLEDYVQMVGRAGRDGGRSACVLLAGRRDAGDLRRFAQGDVPAPEELRAVYRALRGRVRDGSAVVEPEALEQELPRERDVRVLVGMLETAGLVRRGFDSGRRLRVELTAPPEDAGERVRSLLRRYEDRALARVERIVAYADSGECRQRQIAEHFGESLDEECGTCDRCRPRGGSVQAAPAPAATLPDDVAGRILDVVAGLRWPLGLNGLAAMLSGSVGAPPSARRSSDFGALAAARPATVKRWLRRLVESGHLEQYESEDGFRLLRVARVDDPPALATPAAAAAADEAAADPDLFERLRAWRRRRAAELEVPAYVVLPDRTLRALAAAPPATEAELAAVPGIGPVKLERFGAELLAVLTEAPETA